MCALCQTQCPSCCWVGCQHDWGGIGNACKQLWRHVDCLFCIVKHHPLFGHPLFGHPLFVGGNIWHPLQISLWEDPFVPGVREAMFGIVELSCSQFLCNKSEYMIMFVWWHFLYCCNEFVNYFLQVFVPHQKGNLAMLWEQFLPSQRFDKLMFPGQSSGCMDSG
jgi:hypothetical protein